MIIYKFLNKTEDIIFFRSYVEITSLRMEGGADKLE
jgi:hypothetical protein